MKLNKKRVKMLVGIIVGVLLLVGTCIGSIINSVDYEKAEEDIGVIEVKRVNDIIKLEDGSLHKVTHNKYRLTTDEEFKNK